MYASSLPGAIPDEGGPMSNVHVDDDMLEELRMILEGEFPTLIQQFVQDSLVRVQEIEQAVARGDADTLRKEAHSLKGASGNLGLPVLAGYCNELEDAGRAGNTRNLEATVQRLQQERKMIAALLLARI